MSDEQEGRRAVMTPYEITRLQLAGNLLALCVTFVLIAVPGRSTDPEPRTDGNLMRSATEQGYAGDEHAAVTNMSVDAAAGIMACHGEVDRPSALSQSDKETGFKAARAVADLPGVAPAPCDNTLRTAAAGESDRAVLVNAVRHIK